MENMIPFMDLDIQYRNIQKEIDEAIFKVIHSYKFINGPEVGIFEKNFAELQDVQYCVGTSSGTSALHLAYETVGLKPGDEVIVPTMTFIASVEPLKQLGVIPVFVDIDAKTFNIDPEKIENSITQKTRALVAVHLHGNPCEMDALNTIANKYNLKIIEDCAQAHISEYHGNKVGNFSDIATFSFYPGKNLGAYGDAGAVVTNNIEYYKKLKMLNNHGRTDKYLHEIQGYNYRLDTLQAAILNVKIKHLSQWTNQRINHAKQYIDKLINLPVQVPELTSNCKHVFHIFAIAVDNREKIINELKNQHISYGIHYPIPLHLQPVYKNLGYKKGDLPVSEDLADKFISLPMFAEILEENIDFVCNVIEDALK